jgi:plastocyanin
MKLSSIVDRLSSKAGWNEVTFRKEATMAAEPRVRIMGAVAVALAALFLGVSSLAAAPRPADTEDVSITGFQFAPQVRVIDEEDTVSWSNEDPVAHTVTADDGSFDSGALGESDTFEHTFAAIGVVAYHCNIHPNMHGTVVVLDHPIYVPLAAR